MGKSKSTCIAIRGGELAGADSIVEKPVQALKAGPKGRILILTVATNEPEAAEAKYNSLFRSRGVKHVETLDISERKQALSKGAIRKVERADALFFTGGDQLNTTTLLGGSPLGEAIRKKTFDGV